MDCDAGGSDCSTIATGSLDVTPWDGSGVSTWVEKTVSLGFVSHSITSGRTLRVKLVVGNDSGDDMWFAWDTTSFDSRLEVSP